MPRSPPTNLPKEPFPILGQKRIFVLENERLKSFNDEERQAFEWLNDQDNVILTPHVAGWSEESYVKISVVLADKIESHLKGEKIKTETSNYNRQIVG